MSEANQPGTPEQPKNAAPVTQEELRKLPRWAIVAFAARCARRVQPLFVKHWPDAPQNRIKAIDRAIMLTEAAAAGAAAGKELLVAADNAVYAANAAYKSVDPSDGNRSDIAARAAFILAEPVARAAARAARTAYDAHVPTVSYVSASATADSARTATRNTDAYVARADYELLLALAKENNWNDTSPVDVALLGPLWPPGQEPEWAKEETKPADAPVTEDELKKLPRWAVVAFAARCARRVQPLFVKGWPDAPKHHVEAIDAAIQRSEESAKDSTIKENLFEAVFIAIQKGTKVPALAVDASASAESAAQAAAFVDDPTRTDTVALYGYSACETAIAAYDGGYATNTAHDIATRADYELLLALAKEHEWDNSSPVDVALLGPLWPVGQEPDWAKTQPKETDTAGMKIKFTVPDGMSDEEAIPLINDYLGKMSDLHRAMGGSGLRIIPPTDVQEPARVREVVLS